MNDKPELKTSDAQRRATDKWKAEHAEHNRYINQRSAARSFIRNRANADDLDELQRLINDRRQTIDKDV